ncbi:MAG: threonine synthase [Bacillota bacterium]|jgi:threonine synthase
MYISSRGNFRPVTASEAIRLGMVPEGGLFVPEKIPVLDPVKIKEMAEQSYGEVAQTILELFLDDFSQDEIRDIIKKSYNETNFDHPDIAPLAKLDNETYILELWHGPTAAFKDMALQIMPRLLTKSVEKTGSQDEVIIPVATSGDTGKAALEGFKNVPGVRIIVFYPYGGVSKVQELQMTTAEGNNVAVVSVKGNFDDCQTGVKELFADREFNRLLASKKMVFSSANSINWGRLLPQIVYYFWGYAQMLKRGDISFGEKINVVVPTGNFGNILAGYYAYLMGLPVNKFICASNKNKILTDVINTGVYDRRREFYKTSSPSMDILISSNFERFLFEISGHNDQKITKWYRELSEKGFFQVDEEYRKKWQNILIGDYTTDEETLREIKETFTEKGYLLDTHTGVAVRVYRNYAEKTGDKTKTMIDATANPYKFNKAVLEAIAGTEAVKDKDEFMILEELNRVTGMPIHRALKDLDKKQVVYHKVIEKDEIREAVKEILD